MSENIKDVVGMNEGEEIEMKEGKKKRGKLDVR